MGAEGDIIKEVQQSGEEVTQRRRDSQRRDGRSEGEKQIPHTVQKANGVKNDMFAFPSCEAMCLVMSRWRTASAIRLAHAKKAVFLHV